MHGLNTFIIFRNALLQPGGGTWGKFIFSHVQPDKE